MKRIASYISVMLLTLGFSYAGYSAYANPSLNTSSARSSTATTTLATINPGLATTTVTYDSRAQLGSNQTQDGNTLLPDSVALLLYMKASSTLSVLVTNIEYSNDGIDWYQNNLETYAAGAIAIATPNTYTWTFATSTIGGVLNSLGTDVGAKTISVRTPTRFVRAVLSMTGAGGMVRGEFVPKKQLSYSY